MNGTKKEKAVISEGELRGMLQKRVRESGKTVTRLAGEIGVPQPYLSMMMNKAPLTGKVVKWLGYERVKERLFRKR